MEILDVTVREGQQRAGVTYTPEQKVAAAEKLDELGVDDMQIGFPAANDDTKDVCSMLDIKAKTTGIARAINADIDAAADSGVDVVKIGVPTSDLQRKHILGIDREELKELIVEKLDYARDMGLEVQISAMDGFRADPSFVSELVNMVDTEYYGISDTVGIRTPQEVHAYFDSLECDISRINAHFHNDLGLGTANALVAAEAGAGKIDVSVAGLGERAGNVPAEEFVIAAVLSDSIDREVDLQIDRLIPTYREILEILGEDVLPQKPILGKTAFEHESGMHTAAMLKTPAVYEPFDPSRFGGERRLEFGPASGRGAARGILERTSVEVSDENVGRLLEILHGLDETISLEETIELAEARL